MQHNLRDPSRDRDHGRVYRVRYQGGELLKPASIAGEPLEKLLKSLESPDDRVRHRGRIELIWPTDGASYGRCKSLDHCTRQE